MTKITKLIFSSAFAITLISIILMASVPPVSRDAQTHHLAMPKIWLEQGILSETPDIEFSYYPQLIDILYILPVAINSDIIAKYIHFSFGLGTLLLIFFYIRRYLGNFWGLLGGLMFITLPIIVKLSVTVYVDLGLLFFFTAALFSSLIWLEDIKKLKWLIISGLFTGLALSTKYNAMLSVTILALQLGYFFLKTRLDKSKEQFNAIKYLMIFTFVALLVYSPWLIRNYSLTGNPIYPMYQSVFSDTKVSDDKDELEKLITKPLNPFLLRKLLYNESLPYTLAIPLRIFYEGEDDDLSRFDGRLNPLFLLLPFLVLLGKKRRWQNQFLGSYIVLVILYTLFAVDMRIRYVVTIVSPLIVLSVFGLYQLNQRLVGFGKSSIIKVVVMPLILLLYFIYNFLYVTDLFTKINPLPYVTGKISRDDYLNQYLPYYSLNKLANKEVSDEGKLLGIFTGNRRYYLDVPLTLDSRLPFRLAKKVNDGAELYKELTRIGITHVLARTDLLNDELSRTNEKQKKIIADFFSENSNLLASKGRFSLYQIIE
jgi:4-amino-4-deoxy-L-arabinose transferase-like glycosyltransferase